MTLIKIGADLMIESISSLEYCYELYPLSREQKIFSDLIRENFSFKIFKLKIVYVTKISN
jgi:hypothetical protein